MHFTCIPSEVQRMENEEKRELTVNKKESVWVRGMSNDKILQNERKPT